MPPRYVIHIGPLKTGSTYLQECLVAARSELARLDICYPDAFNETAKTRGKWCMHMNVVTALRRQDSDLEELRAEFAKINALGYRTVVLSCEHFVHMSPDRFAALRDVTGAQEFQIVYASRRWSDRFPSLWNQRIVMGGVESLPEFYLSMLSSHRPDHFPKRADWASVSPDLDYSATWRSLCDQFGRDSLAILPYSNILEAGGDVFVHFCKDILGLEKAPEIPMLGIKLWTSMSPEDQEILRVFNELHLQRTGEGAGGLLRRQIRMNTKRKRIDVSAISKAIASHVRALPIDDQAAHFDAPFARMEEFSDRVVGEGPVFDRKSKAARYVSPNYLLDDGVREQLLATYEVVARSLKEPKLRPKERDSLGQRGPINTAEFEEDALADTDL